MRKFGIIWGHVENVFIGVCATIALILSVWEMTTRYFAPQNAKDWLTEVTIYLLVWAMFVAGSGLVQQHRHIRADLIIRLFSPQAQRMLEIFNAVVGVVFCVALTYYGIEVVQFAIMFEERSESSLKFLLYYYYLCLPVGIGLMAVRYLVRLWDYIFRFDPETMIIGKDAIPQE